MSEWKPGDVALVTWADHEATYSEVAVRMAVGDGWQHGLDWGGGSVYDSISNPEVRPLVVIHPDDHEQVYGLACKILDADSKTFTQDDRQSLAWDLEKVLKALAGPTPPKPDEPMGLGAVVEDADGDRWVRWNVAGAIAPWRRWRNREQPESAFHQRWSQVDAVKVLSEGVTS